MSDTEDSTVLGKRTRNGVIPSDETPPVDGIIQPEGNEGAEDESDDDVGPMPMPAGPQNGGVKKKRKGMFSALGAVWS